MCMNKSTRQKHNLIFSVLHVLLFVTQSQSLFHYFAVLGSSCSPWISLAPSLVISLMDRQYHNFPYFILLYNVQSTLALRTPRYYGHPANADKSQPSGETHIEMTETNSHYYWTLAITEMRTLSCPQARNFTSLNSRYSGHL